MRRLLGSFLGISVTSILRLENTAQKPEAGSRGLKTEKAKQNQAVEEKRWKKSRYKFYPGVNDMYQLDCLFCLVELRRVMNPKHILDFSSNIISNKNELKNG